jgi:aldose 1-epimerase
MPPSRFDAVQGEFSDIDAVIVRNDDAAIWAAVAIEGATLLQWRASVAGSVIDLVDGYADSAELKSQDGVRNGVIAPFVNRIAQDQYRFHAASYDLFPQHSDGKKLIYHGFLRTMRLDVVDIVTTEAEARIVFATTGFGPDAFAGYPFRVDLEVIYTVTLRGIQLEVTGHNVGDKPAPYGAGWHSYFRLGTGRIDELEVTIPARTVIRTDDLIPLDGAAAFAPVDASPWLDYRQARRLDGDMLDVCFADLVPDIDGRTRTLLRNPASGAGLSVWQDHGLMHVFTGDTLARDRRRSIALEPVEVMTDAFNRPDCEAAITLLPGAKRSFRCGADIVEPATQP